MLIKKKGKLIMFPLEKKPKTTIEKFLGEWGARIKATVWPKCLLSLPSIKVVQSRE